MTVDEAKVAYPIGVMFDILANYALAQPIRSGCTLTNQEVHDLVVSTKLGALQDPIPPYNAFNFLFVKVFRQYCEGVSPCSTDGKYCTWITHRVTILQDLKRLQGAK